MGTVGVIMLFGIEDASGSGSGLNHVAVDSSTGDVNDLLTQLIRVCFIDGVPAPDTLAAERCGTAAAIGTLCSSGLALLNGASFPLCEASARRALPTIISRTSCKDK